MQNQRNNQSGSANVYANQLPRPTMQVAQYQGIAGGSNPSSMNYQNSQRSSEYDPNDLNSNYRPLSNSLKRRKANARSRKTNQPSHSRDHEASQPPIVKKTENPRMKLIQVVENLDEDFDIQTKLSKVAQDLVINMRQLKGIGFHRFGEEKKTMFLYFEDSEPYAKARTKCDAIAGDDLLYEFSYNAPKNLNEACLPGEFMASAQPDQSKSSIKLFRDDQQEKYLGDILDLLIRWQRLELPTNKTIIEETLEFVRVNKKDYHLTFNRDDAMQSFNQFMKNQLVRFDITLNATPISITLCADKGKRVSKNALAVTSDMLPIFQALGQLTSAQIEWLRLLGSGRYALVEVQSESSNAVELLSNQLMQTGVNTTDEQMITESQ